MSAEHGHGHGPSGESFTEVITTLIMIFFGIGFLLDKTTETLEEIAHMGGGGHGGHGGH